MEELLNKYHAEIFKVGVNPKRHEDYCGEVGLVGLEDRTKALEHASWMISHMLDESSEWSETKKNRWLGFIQGVLWCTKFRGILELRNESREL